MLLRRVSERLYPWRPNNLLTGNFFGCRVTVCYFVWNSKYSSMNDVTGRLDLPDFLPLRLFYTYGHPC